MRNVILLILCVALLTGCGLSGSTRPYDFSKPGYLSSGTIVLSRQVPAESPVTTEESFGPVIGYIPPMTGILPAANELWIEIDTEKLTVTLYRGEEKLSTVKAEGSVSLPPGKYALQFKQKFPTWYAPNSYFEKRMLEVPAEYDESRYLRGALGEYALYPSSGFVIHSAPLYSEDVGGLRLSQEELASLFSQLQVGSSIVIK